MQDQEALSRSLLMLLLLLRRISGRGLEVLGRLRGRERRRAGMLRLLLLPFHCRRLLLVLRLEVESQLPRLRRSARGSLRPLRKLRPLSVRALQVQLPVSLKETTWTKILVRLNPVVRVMLL